IRPDALRVRRGGDRTRARVQGRRGVLGPLLERPLRGAGARAAAAALGGGRSVHPTFVPAARGGGHQLPRDAGDLPRGRPCRIRLRPVSPPVLGGKPRGGVPRGAPVDPAARARVPFFQVRSVRTWKGSAMLRTAVVLSLVLASVAATGVAALRARKPVPPPGDAPPAVAREGALRLSARLDRRWLSVRGATSYLEIAVAADGMPER